LLLGLGQKQLAADVRYSTSAIQRIELGQLELSEALAQRISNETAINAQWLLNNNLKAPFISDSFKLYTEKDYEQRKRDRERGIALPTFAREMTTMAFYSWMRAIFATKDGNVALIETGKFLEKLAKRFGHNQDIMPSRRLDVTALNDLEQLRIHADIGATFVVRKYEDVRRSERVMPPLVSTVPPEIIQLLRKPALRRTRSIRRTLAQLKKAQKKKARSKKALRKRQRAGNG
jgi:transcriptional regulator with XRE-family HTH domain